MMYILVFSDQCKRPHENDPFFPKKLKTLILTFSRYVILFRRHLNR